MSAVEPMPPRPLEIPSDDLVLRGALHRPSEDPGTPCVILSHGLMSTMESPKLRMLAGALGREGIAAVRFDFRGCGGSAGDIRDTTVSGRVTDLEAILGQVRGSLGFTGPLGLLGSSMGGHVSLLAFSRRTDIEAVCVWATPFRLRGLENVRNHPDLSALGPGFFEDLQNHDLPSRASSLHHLLILHGERDDVIPCSQAVELYESASSPRSLKIFPGGDHRFTDPAHRNEALRRSVRWFREHLFPSGESYARKWEPGIG